MKEADKIFKFSDPVDYLNYEFELKRIKNARFSLRSWSHQLGYKNPSFISHILKKKRTLKIDTAIKFSNNLKLTGDSKKYFEILVLLNNSKTAEEKKLYINILDSLRPKNIQTQQCLSLDVFRVVSDWYYTAILELVDLSDFKYDIEWIKNRLGNQITSQNIVKAIERLLKLKLLEQPCLGKLIRAKSNPIVFENYIPNEAIRHFHNQMIEKAKAAIEEQSINERDISGSMISIKIEDYAKIQKIIKKAHSEIIKYSCQGNGEELYQFNTQFFRITKKRGTV